MGRGAPHTSTPVDQKGGTKAAHSPTGALCASLVPTCDDKGLDVWGSPQPLGSLDWPTQPTRSVRWARRPAGRGARPPPDAWRSCCAARLARARPLHAPFALHASRHLTSAPVCMGDRPQLWPAAHPRCGAHRRPDGARSCPPTRGCCCTSGRAVAAALSPGRTASRAVGRGPPRGWKWEGEPG